jgi:hypothetical protein
VLRTQERAFVSGMLIDYVEGCCCCWVLDYWLAIGDLLGFAGRFCLQKGGRLSSE